VGQNRLYCTLNGIPLPERFSVCYYVLLEGMHRARAEKVAFARFLSSFLGPIAGFEGPKVELLLAEYGEELSQLRYNYQYETVRTRIAVVQKAALDEDKRLLAKAASLSVGD
jgi:hypothetical protein